MSKNEKQSHVPTTMKPSQQPQTQENQTRTLSLTPLEDRIAPRFCV